jgi:hypothetical protein
MTLAALIRKREPGKDATAIPATPAIQPKEDAESVARIATVAVANPTAAKTAPLTVEEETAIRAWQAHIEETDPGEIQSVLDECRADSGALAYYLSRAEEVPRPSDFDDDRRRCDQCTNLTRNGRCLAARRGEIEAAWDFLPVSHLPRRCTDYAPGPDDPDRRTGCERWPGLIQKGKEAQ